MTTASRQETADRTQLPDDPDELHDRIINLRDQEDEVHRESAERREREALAAAQRERQRIDRQRRRRVEAYDLFDRQTHDGLRQVEEGADHIARALALSMSALVPPVLRRPTLFIDVVLSAAIAVLSFHREFLNDLLTTADLIDAR